MIRRYATSALVGLIAAVCAIYNAPLAGQDTATQPQATRAAAGQTATRLSDGRFLLVGGQGPGGPSKAASLFDPATGKTVALPAGLSDARSWHTATLLPDGSVLIIGGEGATGDILGTQSASIRPAKRSYPSRCRRRWHELDTRRPC